MSIEWINLGTSLFSFPLAAYIMAALLTLTEMAEQLKVSNKTLKKYVRDLDIPCTQLGSNLRFDEAEVMAILRSSPPAAAKIVRLKPQKPARHVGKKSRMAEALGI